METTLNPNLKEEIDEFKENINFEPNKETILKEKEDKSAKIIQRFFKSLKDKGFKIDVIYGARNKDLLLIQDKIEEVAENVYYATDDGSVGMKGNVCDALEPHIKDYDICVAIGPVIMMKFVCLLTKKYNLKIENVKEFKEW